MTWKVKIISMAQFRALLLKYLVHNFEDCTKEQFIERVLDEGFPQLDKDFLGKCMKAYGGLLFVEPVCVDIGDSMFYWLVSGNDAILVKKTVDNSLIDGRITV